MAGMLANKYEYYQVWHVEMKAGILGFDSKPNLIPIVDFALTPSWDPGNVLC